MIIENSTNAWSFLRTKWHLIPIVLAILVVVEVVNDYVSLDRPAFSLAAVGLMVTALSIFLVFRTNEAYARWWEARTLWGQLVNSSRSFARQVTTLISDSSADGDFDEEVRALRRELLYRQIAFAHALRLSLRGQACTDELSDYLEPGDLKRLSDATNMPATLLQRQGEAIAEVRAAGFLTEIGQMQLDRSLATLHDVQGSCERIKTTPIPDKISFLTRLISWAMAIIIPIAIVTPDNSFDVLDMLGVPFMMLSFVMIERIGSEIRNPFENEPNDIPMTAICRTIERDLRRVIGEKELPPPVDAEDGVLM